MPLHPPPLQPANVEPALGVAASVKEAPDGNCSTIQSPGQRIPRLACWSTLPAPAVCTDSADVSKLKVAVTVVFVVGVKVQLPVPVHGPLQPANTEPGEALAASVTAVPLVKDTLHGPGPQLIPTGALAATTAPLPALALATVTVTGGVAAVNVAVIVVLARTLPTTHVSVPAQPPPDQPENSEPAAGVAESVVVVARVTGG